MSGNSFNPATAGVGTHIITYNVTLCTTLTNSVAIQVVAANASATIAYSTASFCNGITTPQSITQTGTSGGSYTATPAGSSINPTTGAITPSTSAANTYIVTYTIQGAAGCPPFSTNTTVTIGTLSATATSANSNRSRSQTNSVLTATGGGTYAWSGRNSRYQNRNCGRYLYGNCNE